MIRKDHESLRRGTLFGGLLALIAAQTVMAAEGTVLPVKKISVDSTRELVVEFGGGSFPTVPQVLDLPGPNHRVVIDFADATLDGGSVASAEEVSKSVTEALPFVKSVRFSNLENSPKPTVRVVLDLPEETVVKPRVVKLEEGLVTFSFGDQSATTPVPAAANTSAAETTKVAEAGNSGGAWDWQQGGSTESVTTAATPAPTEALRPELAQETKPAADAAGNAAVATETKVESAPAPSAEPVSTPAPAPSTSGENEGTKSLDAVRKYNKAVQLHLSGKLSEAIAEYKLSLEANPGLAEAHSNLGLIYNQQHNYAQALAEFRKALAVNPKDAITYNGIGAALRAEKDLLGAIKNWQTAVSLDPKLATAHYNLGTAYEIQKEYDKAVASYKSAVKNDYRLGEAYYRMGLIMERKHKPEEAAEQFKEALKVSADSEYSEDARQRLAFLQKNKTK